MKELWNVLMEKFKQLEPVVAIVWVGIVGVFTIAMSTIIVTSFFSMLVRIVLAFTGNPTE
jgi:hypothetical protein